MGLGIATSLLLYMFLNGMDRAGYGHSSSGYSSSSSHYTTYDKRSFSKVTIKKCLSMFVHQEWSFVEFG